MGVRVLLKDGTYLECAIYETGVSGECSINNKEVINEKFSKNNIINFKKDMINFQSAYINGKFHPHNVLWYAIIEDDDD